MFLAQTEIKKKMRFSFLIVV